MPIVYPLTPPSFTRFSKLQFIPRTTVSASSSAFTGQQQTYDFTGQWWEAEITLPAMNRAQGAPWFAFLLALNGISGTFSLGDSIGTVPQGSVAGSPTVGAGAALGSTTLPISGGTGTFALGDWLQIGTNLHMVTQVNSGSVDVFPTLRSAWASGTAITYNNARGLFRLKAPIPFAALENRLYDGLAISVKEAL